MSVAETLDEEKPAYRIRLCFAPADDFKDPASRSQPWHGGLIGPFVDGADSSSDRLALKGEASQNGTIMGTMSQNVHMGQIVA